MPEERDYYTQDFRPWGLQDSGRESEHPRHPPRRQCDHGQTGLIRVPHAGRAHQRYSNRVLAAAPMRRGRCVTPFQKGKTASASPGRISSPIPAAIPPFRILSTLASRRLETFYAVVISFTPPWIRRDAHLFGVLGPVSFLPRGFYSGPEGQAVYPSGNGQARQVLYTNLVVPTFTVLPGRGTQWPKGRLQLCDRSAHIHQGGDAPTVLQAASISTSCPSIGT